MNERIRELARKSGATVNEGFDGTKNFVYGITMSPEELDKFAELIIRECCDIVHSKTDESIRVVMAIEQHFGVD